MLAALWLAVGAASASAPALVRTIPVGLGPNGVSSDGTDVWVAQSGAVPYRGDHTVSEIDALTGRVVRAITVGKGPTKAPEGVSSDGTHVWVTNYGDGEDSSEAGDTVTEIDASTGTVVRMIKVGVYPEGVSSDGTHVWVANPSFGTVSEIDTSTGTVVRTITVGVGLQAVSSDGTHVWVTGCVEYAYNGFYGIVSEIDAATGTVVRTIRVGGCDTVGVSSDGTHVWVANGGLHGTVNEIDASTGTVVRTIRVGYDPAGVSSDGTHVWVLNAPGLGSLTYGAKPSVSEIDASTGTVVHTIKAFSVFSQSQAVSSDGTHVWVTNVGGSNVSEIAIGSGSPSCVVPRLGHMILAAAMRALLRAHCTLGSVRKPKHPGPQQVLRVSRQSAVPGSRHRTAYKVNIALT